MAQYWRDDFQPDANMKITMSRVSSSYIEVGTVVTVKANDGYVIDTLTAETNLGEKKDLTEQAQGKEEYKFQPHSILSDGFSVNKCTVIGTTKAVEKGQVVEYSFTIDNAKSSIDNGATVEETDTIKLTANKFYRFSEIKFVFSTEDSETPETFTLETTPAKFNKIGNEFEIALSEYWNEELTNITVTGITERYVSYTEYLEYSESSITSEIIEETDTLNLKADEGYYFGSGINVYVTVNGDRQQKTYKQSTTPDYFNEDGYRFILPMSDIWVEGIESVYVNAPAKEIPPPKEASYVEVLENVTSNIDTHKDEDEDYVYLGKIKENESLILTADEDFSFQDSIEVIYNRSNNIGHTKMFYPNSESDTKYFNDENTMFKLEIGEFWEWDVNSVHVHANAKESYTGGDDEDLTDSTTDFAKIYYADNSVLSSISAERYSAAGAESLVPTDMGAYIYQVYKFPLRLKDEYISKSSNRIQMGYHTVETKSRYLLRSRIKFDLGTVMVPEVYNNIYDYRDTQCLLHVPYAEPIEIDSTYVIGQMVKLAYFLDLYNGTVTLEVYSDKIDGGLVQRVQDVPLSFDIPFIQPQYNSVLNRVGGYINNKVTTPYIEVVRNIPYDPSATFGKEGKEFGKLDSFRGYIEVADLDLSSTATSNEQEEIESLLTQGVVINKPVSERN